MKRLEELDISPVPWSADKWDDYAIDAPRIRDSNDDAIAQPEASYFDACMQAAAPDMYSALLDCMSEMCKYCRKDAANTMPGVPCENGCAVMLAAKAALEKAGGAE